MNVRIINRMRGVFVVPVDGKPEIMPGLSTVVSKEAWDKAIKGNVALQSHVDEKRLIISEVATNPSEPKEEIPVEELETKTSNPEKPPELEDTANAEVETSGNTTAKHTVKSVSEAEIPEGDKPKGGKRGSKKKDK